MVVVRLRGMGRVRLLSRAWGVGPRVCATSTVNFLEVSEGRHLLLFGDPVLSVDFVIAITATVRPQLFGSRLASAPIIA